MECDTKIQSVRVLRATLLGVSIKENEKSNQMSSKRLTKVTFDYGLSQNIIKLVKSMYDYKLSQAKNLNSDKRSKLLDESIKDSFYILRHWFQYKLPKLLSVLNELQFYVCNIYGLVPGNYLYYSSIIENDFYSRAFEYFN